ESPCFFFAGIAFTTISYSSTSIKISIQPLHSPGKRRAVTPGTAITRPTENIYGNSTCPKTPQDYPKEGRLKPFFANNVDIPFARARRLRPCPRKASAQSDPGRRELLRIIPNGSKLISHFTSTAKKVIKLIKRTINFTQSYICRFGNIHCIIEYRSNNDEKGESGMQRVTNCILINNGHVLLLKKPRRRWYAIPGGKMEQNETIKEAVIRECLEETDLNIHHPELAGVFTFSIFSEGVISDEWMMFTFVSAS